MKFKIPHVFIFLSIIILFCAMLTYIVPSGSFERTTRKYGKIEQSVVVPGSYKELPKHFSVKGFFINEKVAGKASPISLIGLLTAIPKGMQQSAALIFFVFIAGAIFNVIMHTGTINAVLFFLIQKFRHAPTTLFFLIYLTVSLASSFMGIASELIPLIPIFILLTKEFGYDRMFGFALIALPMFIGWTAAITNPFNVTIAQQIAELPLGSGMGLRIVLFFVFLVIGFAYMMRYGKRVKQNKINSLMPDYSDDIEGIGSIEKQNFTFKHLMILTVLVVGYAMIMISVQTIGWGLIEMTGGFIGIGILVILISGLSGDAAMRAFVNGLATMIVPALVVGVARGISVVMQEGYIIDTILASASNNLIQLPKFVAGEGMLVFQSTLNFFIPSASGQALVSMPLLTPLSDLLGISRQTGVLAFVLGDGISNIVIPTNGVLMAMLGLAAVPFEKWFRFVLPLFLILMVIAFLTIFLAIWMGY
ncbi:hypothetical protein [Lutimonas vermicola]|uniref:YfcC family protein n=1 Tax=Lutimonas vermicola TaxID=414288 RepID=A0ABU9L496_9FLAO